MKPRVRNRNRTRNIILVLTFLLSFSLVILMVYALDIDFVSPTAADDAPATTKGGAS